MRRLYPEPWRTEADANTLQLELRELQRVLAVERGDVTCAPEGWFPINHPEVVGKYLHKSGEGPTEGYIAWVLLHELPDGTLELRENCSAPLLFRGVEGWYRGEWVSNSMECRTSPPYWRVEGARHYHTALEAMGASALPVVVARMLWARADAGIKGEWA